MSQILVVMKKLHNNGLVLWDLKTNNVMLTDQGHIWLIDLEFMIKEGEEHTKAGTLEYMAPEIV